MKWAIPLVFLASHAVANDGWWVATGELGGFGKHDQIQMVEERIAIDLRQEFAHVSVDFLFKNHGGATPVTLGFPEEYAGPMDRGFRSLSSTVDGIRQPVRRKVLSSDAEWRFWNVVWLKDVRFEADQSVPYAWSMRPSTTAIRPENLDCAHHANRLRGAAR